LFGEAEIGYPHHPVRVARQLEREIPRYPHPTVRRMKVCRHAVESESSGLTAKEQGKMQEAQRADITATDVLIRLLIHTVEGILRNPELRRKLFSRTKYLNYDPVFLCDSYKDEQAIGFNIPYKEVICWIHPTQEETERAVSNISVKKLSHVFELKSDSAELVRFQHQALTEFKSAGKMNERDGNVVRLQSYRVGPMTTVLTIQKAKYSDQVKSNLVMDWKDKHPLKDIGFETLRQYLAFKHRGRKMILPPMATRWLANTIGISVIVLYKDSQDKYVPYLTRRAKGGIIDKKKTLAVFEGGYHCTASGAAEWNQYDTFDDFLTRDMYRELDEEVGLEKNDIELMCTGQLEFEHLRKGCMLRA
jgi:hypothetical protein